MSDKKLVVFDTRNAVTSIHDYISHVHAQQPLIGLAVPTLVQARQFVKAMVEEIFEARDKNVIRAEETDWEVVRASLLFGIPPGQILHRQVKFAIQVFSHKMLDTLYDDLKQQVNVHEKLLTYNKWEVVLTGTVIAAIERGDARVLQWKELQDAQGDSYHTLHLGQLYEAFRDEFFNTHGPYPESQLDAMVIKAVMDMFPQLRRTDHIEQVNYDIAVAYGIPPLHEWLDEYMKKVMVVYNVASFGVHIPAGPTYECDYINHVLTVRAIKAEETVEVVDSDKELALQLMRGDYLPREDRERAERYVLENY